MDVYLCIYCAVFFFFKQKTAYEMRISDWSSDVCSSDLGGCADQPLGFERLHARRPKMLGLGIEQPAPGAADQIGRERELQFLRLEQDGETGQRSFRQRRACQDRKSTRLNSSH